MFLLPGMDQPEVRRTPVSSYEECLAHITQMLALVQSHDGQTQKVFLGCEIAGVKTDPA